MVLGEHYEGPPEEGVPETAADKQALINARPSRDMVLGDGAAGRQVCIVYRTHRAQRTHRTHRASYSLYRARLWATPSRPIPSQPNLTPRQLLMNQEEPLFNPYLAPI